MSENAVDKMASRQAHVVPGTEPIVVWIDDPDLEEMIPMFLENRHKDVAALRRAVAAGDFALIRRLGHDMKGTGAGYGFDGITDIGGVLERAAIEEDDVVIDDAVRALAGYLQRVTVRIGALPSAEHPGAER